MNFSRLFLAIAVGIFAMKATAGEPQRRDPVSTQAIAKNEESAELQEIRWLISESCAKNPECTNRIAPGFNAKGFVRPMAQPDRLPSTPERRRALGLLDDSSKPQ